MISASKFLKNSRTFSRKVRTFGAKFAKIRENGDSLVEVALAITVLSIIAVGSMMAMNRGNSVMENTLVRTEVRAMINSQTNILQFLGDKKGTVDSTWNNPANITNQNAADSMWNTIKSWSINPASQDDSALQALATNYTPGAKSFYLAATPTATSVGITGYIVGSKDKDNNEKHFYVSSAVGESWIDAACFANNPQPYCDFYIKAIWQASNAGESGKSHTVTIVRIYE